MMFKNRFSQILFRLAVLVSVVLFWVTGTPAQWTIQTIDGPKYFSSDLSPRAIATDSSNHPHIAYGKDHLYHAYHDGGMWHYETVDTSPAVGSFAAIGIDSANKIHISYYAGALKYATDASGTWVTEVVDSVWTPGQYVSMVLDSNGKAHISYHNGYYGLKYATNASGIWNIQTVSASNAGWGTDIAIDSLNKVHIAHLDLTNRDLMYSTNASGSWVTSAIDTANVGGLSIGIDSSDKIHIIYYEVDSGYLKHATNESGPWASENVDYVSQSGTCSVVVDASGVLHVSYFSYLNGISYQDFKYARGTTGSWSIETVESTGRTGFSSSIALDLTNKAHLSYFRYDTGELKYATGSSGSWSTQTVDVSEDVGQYTSIATDTSDNIHISYSGALPYQVNYATNASGPWTIDQVLTNGYGTGKTSLALDSSSKSHITYYDNGRLNYATNASGPWTTEMVEPYGQLGLKNSLAIDSSDKAHVAYDYNDGASWSLKYATNASGSWVWTLIDTIGMDSFNSIAVDLSDKVHIAYYDDINYVLKYATNATGSWVIETVDSDGYVGQSPSMAIDSAGKIHVAYIGAQLLKYATNASGSWVAVTVDSVSYPSHSSLALDSSDKVHISYYVYYVGGTYTKDLKYATNASGSWVNQTIDSAGDVGMYSSIAVDSLDNIHISYYDASNRDLKYATSVILASSDLSVTQSDAPDPVQAGNQVTYTVTVTNHGPDTAAGVVLTDTLPGGATFVQANSTQGSCMHIAGVVNCNIGDMINGGIATVTLVVTAPASGGTILNTVAVAASSNDTNTSNNAVAEGTTVQTEADLSLTQTDSPDPVIIGNNLTYTATITNNGPTVASGAVLTDTLPDGVTFVSALSTQGTCGHAAGVVTCSVGTMAVSATVTVTIVIKAPNTGGSVSNSPVVSSASADPNPGNNTATSNTTVLFTSADISVSQVDSTDPVLISQALIYTATVRNNGPDTATGVVLTDNLPPGAAFVAAGATQGSCSHASGTVTCTIGDMSNGATVTVTITLNAPAATGLITNTVNTIPSNNDPNPANNRALELTGVVLNLPAEGTIHLPRTGQTLCYDETGNEIPCAGTGQDGDTLVGIAWPNPRFTDNANGTITDNLTGLMWLKDGNCMGTRYPGFDQDGTIGDGRVTWQHALDFVAGINNGTYLNCGGGHGDWHLPNVNELQSLFHFGFYEETCSNMLCWDNTAWLRSKAFQQVYPYYWSANSHSGGHYYAWYFDMSLGTTASREKTDLWYNSVWPVRLETPAAPARVWRTGEAACYAEDGSPRPCAGTGEDGEIQAGVPWPDPRLSDNGDGTVIDNLTGLMWLKNANCAATRYPSFDQDGTAGDGQITWQHALDFVAGINSGAYPDCGAGYTNWRVPNMKELLSLVDQSRFSPALPGGGTPFANWSYSWSSTSVTYEYTLSTNKAWNLEPSWGNAGSFSKVGSPIQIWPVRSNSGSDLAVTIQGSPDPVSEGGQVTYAITITNHGPMAASGVVLTDVLPAGSSFSSYAATQGTCSHSGDTVTCDVGAMANGVVATVTISVNAPALPGTITNVASVSCSGIDPNSSNNRDGEKTWVGGAVTLTVLKEGGGGGAVSGPGIDCGSDCSQTFAGETEVVLTATPNPNSYFAGWTGDACFGAGDCSLTTDRNKNVIAVFNSTIGPVVLPKMGQTTSYAPGDSGDIRSGAGWPDPRFVITYCNETGPCADQGSDCDGNASTDVITDYLTGLMWPRDGDLANAATGFTWDSTFSYTVDYINGRVMGEGVCGLRDWRVPNINELLSLSHGQSSPPGFVNLKGLYWSSTTWSFDSTYAWHVNTGPAGSTVSSDLYLKFRADNRYLLPVRNAPVDPVSRVWRTGQTTTYNPEGGDDGDLRTGVQWPDPRFNVTFCDSNGPCASQISDCDGNSSTDVVRDNLTGLIWARDANLPNGGLPWQEALNYAANSTGCGYTDWRLPDTIELRSLYDYSKTDILLPTGHPFVNLADGYWSSNTYIEYSIAEAWTVWYVGFMGGRIGLNNKTTDPRWVWPVRSGTVDRDDDGIPTQEEMGPAGDDAAFDGNGDGTPDSRQGNVASLHTFGGVDYVTVASSNGTALANVAAVNIPSPGDAPAGVSFTYGFFEFSVNGIAAGGAATVTIYLPAGASPTTYYKYGATPANHSPHWYEFLFDGQTGAEISGNVITLHFVDGQRGDDDLVANGAIPDQGGPGFGMPSGTISVSPSSKEFLTVNVDSTVSQSFVFSNSGLADLVINSVELLGNDPGMFNLKRGGTHPCPTFTPTIAPSGSCTLLVSFTPTSEGAKSAILRIQSNDPVSPKNVALDGQGTIQSVFADCTEGYWAEDFINTLYYSGVTGGCGGGNYCPDNPVTRAQMAVFIVSAMGQTPSTAAYNAYFDDIADNGFAPFINRMNELGITSGCGLRAYCPNALLTRQQMAVFIIAAMGETGSTVAYNTSFDDIANDGFAGFINRMNELGITGGCGTRAYCPNASTNRAMMAVFLVTAF